MFLLKKGHPMRPGRQIMVWGGTTREYPRVTESIRFASPRPPARPEIGKKGEAGGTVLMVLPDVNRHPSRPNKGRVRKFAP